MYSKFPDVLGSGATVGVKIGLVKLEPIKTIVKSNVDSPIYGE